MPTRMLWLLALCFSAHASAQTVTSVDVSKGIGYLQTSATNVVVNGPAAYSFDVGVRGTGLASLVPTPTISGPIDTGLLGASFDGTLAYSLQESAWVWHGQYASAPALDARFGSGVYTLTVNGIAVPLELSGDAYPNPPMVSFSQGAWVDGKFHFDPSLPLTITSNGFTGYAPKGGIALGWGIGFRDQLAVDNPTNSISVTVPPNSFAAGQEFGGFVQFGGSGVDEYHGAFYGAAGYRAFTAFALKAEPPPPVFPMTVTANIGPVTSNASALIQPRPQDVGTTASVYVFALAPANLVQNAQTPGIAETKSVGGQTKADEPAVQCVLAQLSGTGQLVGVSASSLQAYVTGVLGAQQQAVTILNGVPTVNIGGAIFYVGYGSSPLDMVSRGINQRAVAVPSANVCDPKPPQTGWWWNPAEDGRGYSIEVHGRNLFFASFLYDVTGRSSWYVATGPWSLDGSLFDNRLLGARGGQTLWGAYSAFPALKDEGAITLAFNNSLTGTLVWPGGAVPIQRFSIVPNGLTLPPVPNQPESGWWWNPAEAGRGFFLEWQGGILNIAGYMYDNAGDPVWYLTQNATPTTNAQSFSSSWWSFANGMTLMGPWKPHARIDDNVAPVTIQFQGSENAIMTLPNGRTTAITRHRF
jgi:hypothetical protein